MGNDGEIPWYISDLYLYHTGEPIYYAHPAGDYTKVSYSHADKEYVVEVYHKDRVINKYNTKDPYRGTESYYTNLNNAMRKK